MHVQRKPPWKNTSFFLASSSDVSRRSPLGRPATHPSTTTTTLSVASCPSPLPPAFHSSHSSSPPRFPPFLSNDSHFSARKWHRLKMSLFLIYIHMNFDCECESIVLLWIELRVPEICWMWKLITLWNLIFHTSQKTETDYIIMECRFETFRRLWNVVKFLD